MPKADLHYTPSRRTLPSELPVCATEAVLPATLRAGHSPDSDFITICAELVALQNRIEAEYPAGCNHEEEQVYLDEIEKPIKDRQEELLSQLATIAPRTLEGHAARAKVISTLFPDRPTDNGYNQMCAELIRDLIAGGVA